MQTNSNGSGKHSTNSETTKTNTSGTSNRSILIGEIKMLNAKKSNQVTSIEFDQVENRIEELKSNHPRFNDRIEITLGSWYSITVWIGGRRAYTGSFTETFSFLDGLEIALD